MDARVCVAWLSFLSMLDELNEDTDKASDALQAVTKKTKELIEQSGTPLLSCGADAVLPCPVLSLKTR